jgi:hypothetical protein
MTSTFILAMELARHGVACARVPGGVEVCYADRRNRIISIGADIPDHLAGIIGMHELGHIVTMPVDDMPRLYINPERRYLDEFEAWDWAKQRIPEEFWPDLEMVRKWALTSYRK